MFLQFMAKALSCSALLRKHYKLLQFKGDWYDAFGTPESNGVWFIWGGSGNGKTTFVLSLVKQLAQFGRVAFNSLEESSAHTMQNAFLRVGMADVARRVILLERESIAELSERLQKRRSPDIVVIDSFQYAELSYGAYKRLKEANPTKLIIFVSHADGKKPAGRTANSVMYDASLKVWVEGYRAFSKGRYIGPVGSLTVWGEGAEKYWGK
jgi:molybdopterin-guanine dinucleotide biosynthesis protein